MNWAMSHRQYFLFQLEGEAFWNAVFWVREGSMWIHTGEQSVQLHAGDWAFLQPGKRSFEIPVDTVYATVGFNMRWAGEGEVFPILKHRLLKESNLPVLEDKTLRLCVQMYTDDGEGSQWRRIQERPTKSADHFHLRYLFHDWLRSWLEVMEARAVDWCHLRSLDKQMVDIVYYLENLSLEKPIDIEALAKESGQSVRQITGTFQRQYGMTLRSWREQFLLREAMRRLQETREPIKEVAATFGLSPSYFTAWIKRRTGYHSTDLRQQRSVNL